MRCISFLFFIYSLIGRKLLYNVVLVSAIRHCSSAIITHTSPSWACLPSPPTPRSVITERQAELPGLYSNFSLAICSFHLICSSKYFVIFSVLFILSVLLKGFLTFSNALEFWKSKMYHVSLIFWHNCQRKCLYDTDSLVFVEVDFVSWYVFIIAPCQLEKMHSTCWVLGYNMGFPGDSFKFSVALLISDCSIYWEYVKIFLSRCEFIKFPL